MSEGAQGGEAVTPRQRGEDRDAPEDPEDEDGTSLDAHAVNRARAAARDGEIDTEQYKDYLRGEDGARGEDGPEDGTAYSPTTLAGISEALHQDSLALYDGRRETVEAVAAEEEVAFEERVLALTAARQEVATLEAEAATLETLEEHEDFVEEGVDSIDGDGVVESDGGDVDQIDGLTQSDIDQRQIAIDAEIAESTAEIDLLAATFTDEEEAILREASESDEGFAFTAVEGYEPITLDDEVVDKVLADAERFENPAAAGTETETGTEGADAAPETPPYVPPADPELLALAGNPESGVLNGPPENYGFNEGGELVYYAQPGDGYWHAAEAVDPPAGQDFQTHWMNTWTENSMRNHGVPNEQFVGVGQPVVIPGYTRDGLLAVYAPPPVDTDGGGADGGTDGAGTDGTGESGETGDTGAGGESAQEFPPAGTGTPVAAVRSTIGPEGSVTLLVEGEELEVPQSAFVPGGAEGSSYATVPYGGMDVIIAQHRNTGPEQGMVFELVVPTSSGEPSSDEDEEAGEEDPNATVQVGEHEVLATGIDSVETSGGGANVYYNGEQVAHVYTDNTFDASAGDRTDELIQAMLADGSLVVGGEGGDGDRDYTLNGVEVEDGSALELALETLTDHYLDGEDALR